LFTAALCEEHGNLEANARLIAAAPDLLSALSAIVADYHALQRTQGASASLGAEFTAGEWLGSRLGGHIAQAESAIAKAKEEA
jgi:CelD/BcsL family acetyltransferase involved in cellulose biosynthesis